MNRCGNRKLIFYPPIEWGGLFQRPHHLAIQMADLFEQVVFIQPPGLRNPSWKDLGRLKNIIQPLSNKRKGQRTIHDRLKVRCLPFLPFHGLKAIEAFNGWIFSRFVQRAVSGAQPAILWIGAPAPFLKQAIRMKTSNIVIFDWMDDYSLFPQLPLAVADMQYWLLRRADLVFTSSALLFKRAEQIRRDSTWLLPNGVDLDHWDPVKYRGKSIRFGAGKKVIGYFGTISHWLDQDLVSALARRHADWDFVFIGPRADVGSLDSMFTLPNCYHVPSQPYKKLPELASGFDVCWIPFNRGSLVKSINPVKAYEYLALGKPVVSIPLPDLGVFEDLVAFASDVSSFEKAITDALWSNRSGEQDRIRASLRPFGWAHLSRQAVTVIEDFLENRPSPK